MTDHHSHRRHAATRERVLADLTQHPGSYAADVVSRLGVAHSTVAAALSDLRVEGGHVAPDGTLVPIPLDDVGAVTWVPGARDLYVWACDVVGSPADYAHVHGIGWSTARALAAWLRRHGLVEPARTIWTMEQVEAAQDAAWMSASVMPAEVA